MPRQHLPFVDWLKTAGLALIVYGHVAAATLPYIVAPVYQKQLGVAFFVFATGFTLARERRTGWRVLYDRLFELCSVGLGFAVVMSAVGLRLWGDSNQSNYLPLAAGLNVAVDAFPANPTTWYIGTYIHLLVVWSLVLRKVRVTLPRVVAIGVGEVLIRAALIEGAGRFVAYMFLGNWMTVLALGFWMGSPSRTVPSTSSRWPAVFAALALVIGWPLLIRSMAWHPTFPFMSLSHPGLISVLTVSAAVSFVYAAYTLAAYALARTLRAHVVVNLFARNTVIVVIVHMPVYYLLEWLLRPAMGYAWRVSLEFAVCFVGLTLVSELLRPALALKRRRDELAGTIDRLITKTHENRRNTRRRAKTREDARRQTKTATGIS